MIRLSIRPLPERSREDSLASNRRFQDPIHGILSSKDQVSLQRGLPDMPRGFQTVPPAVSDGRSDVSSSPSWLMVIPPPPPPAWGFQGERQGQTWTSRPSTNQGQPCLAIET
ncbi:uncharacterized protein LOC143827697 isoform X1 [Paroedura picta]|uniref:uncharacterized protein LOC143827697 isoform X1 n=1 Tax=Paroedura picta TaxID=143630 RepID=UPI004057A4BA